MASKPTIALARWADLGGSFVTDPTSGERDTGFQDATPAEADKVNALLLQLYLWALYLNDGALAGNHSITGTLGVSSTLTVSAGGAAVTGNSSVTGTLTASDLITANNGISVPTGKDITLAGTADLNHGDRTKTYSPVSAVGQVAGWVVSVATQCVGISSSTSTVMFFSIDGLVAGDRVKSISIITSGNGVTDASIDVRYSNGTSTSTIGSVTLTNPSSTKVSTPIDVTDTTMEAGGIVWIEINTFGGGDAIFIGTITVTFDHP